MRRRGLLGLLAAAVAAPRSLWAGAKPLAPAAKRTSAAALRASLMVAADGSGDFTTLQAALAAIAPGGVILLKPGHAETLSAPLIVSRPGITVRGCPREPARFAWAVPVKGSECPN